MTTGLKMLDFIKGNATMEDVIRQLDEDQDSCLLYTLDVYKRQGEYPWPAP